MSITADREVVARSERARRSGCDDVPVSARQNFQRASLRSFFDYLEDIPIPEHGFTVADLLEMPDSRYRVELTDGVIAVSPSASNPHQFMAMALGMRLYEKRTEGLTVNQSANVELAHNTSRIPDVLVVRSGLKRKWYRGDEVVVAIEIESPSSVRDDRTMKPQLYAEVGIPHYWRIELEPELVAVRYHLHEGAYVEAARSPRIEVGEPFPFAVDLADLLDPDA
jgi:Uma2 family endonuclease